MQRLLRRWWFWTLIGFLVLMATARLLLTTSIAHSIVKKQVERTVNRQPGVSLVIGRVSGDLWNEVRMDHVLLKTGSDTVAAVDTLRAGYRLFSFLFTPIQIYDLEVIQPTLHVKRDTSGAWNFSDIFESAPQNGTGTGLSLAIERLSIYNGSFDGRFATMDQESPVRVRNLTLGSSVKLEGQSFDIQLDDLSFRVLHDRLPAPLDIQTSASVSDELITLEQLVLATGSSIVRSAGKLDLADSTTRVDISALPLSWEDVESITELYPVRKNLEIDLGIKGSFEQLDIMVNAAGEGIERLHMETGINIRSDLTLNRFSLSAGTMDLGTLMNDLKYPEIEGIELGFDGTVPVNNLERTSVRGFLKTGRIRLRQHQMDSLSISYNLDEGRASAKMNAARGKERITGTLEMEQVWNQVPAFDLTAAVRRLDPGYWMGDATLNGNLGFTARVRGTGVDVDSRDWKYRIDLTKSEMAGQRISGLVSRGSVVGNKVDSRSTITIEESKLTLQAEVRDYFNVPEYRFSLVSENLNLAEIRGLEMFTTSINGTVEGKGRGLTRGDLDLASSIRIDSSVINREKVESIVADINVRDTVAQVRNASISSEILSGTFGVRMHLQRLYDSENRLNLDLELKDLQSLAPLVDIENLQAMGEISGQLAPIYEDNLKFEGFVDLRDLVYNNLFTSRRVLGEVEALIVEKPEFVLNVQLDEPVFQSVYLQDLSLTTRGTLLEDRTDGNFQVTFNSSGGSRIQQFGTYTFRKDSVAVNTIDLRLISDLRTLHLQKPFDIVYSGSVLRMDTVQLASADRAYLEAAIPYADTTTQRGYLEGRELNLTVIQNTLLNESYLGGILSGKLEFERRDTILVSRGDLKIRQLLFRGATMDSVHARYDLESERLNGELYLYKRGEILAQGELDVPFKLGNPEQFDRTFFSQPVSGSFYSRPVELSLFKEMLVEAGLTNTDGIIRARGKVDGTAGNPRMAATASLTSAKISGIPVDSLVVKLDYLHEESTLKLLSTLQSLKQKAAEAEIELPLFIDPRSYKVDLPDGSDSLRVEVNTRNFNLASLNDFFSRANYREFRGNLNGSLSITGTFGNPATGGRLNLSNGAVRIVKAGIRVEGIKSTVAFNADTVKLTGFQAKSGRGTLNASGFANLNRLRPDSLNFSLNAENFRVANTSDYAGIVNIKAGIDQTFTNPRITGTLDIVNGYVYLRNFGEKSVETVQLDTPVTPDYEIAVYDSLEMDLNINFNRRFFVRNRRFLDMETELEGNLNVNKKRNSQLQLFGTLNTVSGYARPLGKRFELEEGAFTFTGDMTNPGLNIRTRFESPQPDDEIRIWYIIEGTVENPQFKYESSPPMELQNIISYTLFGQPYFALDSWKQVVANSSSGSAPSSVAVDLLLDRVETLATRRLGIDVVRIDNTLRSGESGTAIKTGWYINPKVFFAIQNEITGAAPNTIFILEYLLRKNLKLIITQGDDNREGIDLKWNYDY